MRNVTPLAFSILFLTATAVQVPAVPSEFLAAFVNDATVLSTNSTSDASEQQHDILKRQFGGGGGCPDNHNPCLGNGYRGACCTAGSFCTTDFARNVACCRNGATCTGTLGVNGAPNTGAFTTTTTNGFGSPTTPAPQVTYFTNQYFPFPVIATSYPNSAACNVAYEACQTNFAACTANLQGGGGFGVTVVAPNGGGVTVNPTAQNLGQPAASSICRSLSGAACYNIGSGDCAAFGTGEGFVPSQTRNVGARATMGCIVAAAAGVGMGIVGQML